MPPAANPSPSQDPTTSALAAELRQIAGALKQISEAAHGSASGLKKAGDKAEDFGRDIVQLKDSLHRSFRDVMVATHFSFQEVAKALKRSARDQQTRNFLQKAQAQPFVGRFKALGIGEDQIAQAMMGQVMRRVLTRAAARVDHRRVIKAAFGTDPDARDLDSAMRGAGVGRGSRARVLESEGVRRARGVAGFMRPGNTGFGGDPPGRDYGDPPYGPDGPIQPPPRRGPKPPSGPIGAAHLSPFSVGQPIRSAVNYGLLAGRHEEMREQWTRWNPTYPRNKAHVSFEHMLSPGGISDRFRRAGSEHHFAGREVAEMTRGQPPGYLDPGFIAQELRDGLRLQRQTSGVIPEDLRDFQAMNFGNLAGSFSRARTRADASFARDLPYAGLGPGAMPGAGLQGGSPGVFRWPGKAEVMQSASPTLHGESWGTGSIGRLVNKARGVGPPAVMAELAKEKAAKAQATLVKPVQQTAKGMAELTTGTTSLASKMAMAAPVVGAFMAGAQFMTTAAQGWAGLVSSMVQAASPNVWRSFTGNLEILMAHIGTAFIPTFVDLMVMTVELVEAWKGLPEGVRGAIGAFATLRPVIQAFGETMIAAIDAVKTMADPTATPWAKGKALGRLAASGGVGAVNVADNMAGEVGRAARGGKDAGGVGTDKKIPVDLTIQQPRFSAVESVWESLALGFLKENDIDRQLMEIHQQNNATLVEILNELRNQKKPGR